MNIEEIDKWLNNEYGVSYTRLEELHDFVIEQNMKYQDKINNLYSILTELEEYLEDGRMNSTLLDEYTLLEVQLKIDELKEKYK